MGAGVTELRNTRNSARKRHLANAAQTTSGDAYETPSGRRVITASWEYLCTAPQSLEAAITAPGVAQDCCLCNVSAGTYMSLAFF